MDKTKTVDIFYSTFNRLTFVRISFSALIQNTNWNLVNLLYIADDGSTDGTTEYLLEKRRQIPTKTIFIRKLKKESPNLCEVGKEFNRFLKLSKSYYVSRIDSDAVVPKEWIERFLKIMSKYSDLYFLSNLYGLLFSKSKLKRKNLLGYYEVNAVGGVGLFRKEAFEQLGFPKIEERFLFNFQLNAKKFNMKSGFAFPPGEQIAILDWLKEFESLANIYIKRGWAREQNIKVFAPSYLKCEF